MIQISCLCRNFLFIMLLRYLQQIFDGIRNFIAHSEISRKTTFHETLTYFWVHMVDYAIAATKNPSGDFKGFLLMNPQLSNGGLYLEYYSKSLMMETPKVLANSFSFFPCTSSSHLISFSSFFFLAYFTACDRLTHTLFSFSLFFSSQFITPPTVFFVSCTCSCWYPNRIIIFPREVLYDLFRILIFS